MEQQIRILLADDHPLVRAGIQNTLQEERDLMIVGEATNIHEIYNLCQKHQPDILLLDLHMPGDSPTQVVTYLKDNYVDLRVLVLTAYDDESYIRAMTMLGVQGYLLKDEAPDAIVHAIRIIMTGQSWFSRSIVEKLLYLQPGIQTQSEKLTHREQDLLTLLARGLDNISIAQELNLAEQTIRNYLTRLYSKLQVPSRNQAIVWAIKHGFEKSGMA